MMAKKALPYTHSASYLLDQGPLRGNWSLYRFSCTIIAHSPTHSRSLVAALGLCVRMRQVASHCQSKPVTCHSPTEAPEDLAAPACQALMESLDY